MFMVGNGCFLRTCNNFIYCICCTSAFVDVPCAPGVYVEFRLYEVVDRMMVNRVNIFNNLNTVLSIEAIVIV